MTKTWDPDHAATVPHWRRGSVRKKRTVPSYGPIAKRNMQIQMARRLARTEHVNQDLKLSMIRSRIIRANKMYPVSRRQVCGMIELLGRSNAEKVCGEIWL